MGLVREFGYDAARAGETRKVDCTLEWQVHREGTRTDKKMRKKCESKS